MWNKNKPLGAHNPTKKKRCPIWTENRNALNPSFYFQLRSIRTFTSPPPIWCELSSLSFRCFPSNVFGQRGLFALLPLKGTKIKTKIPEHLNPHVITDFVRHVSFQYSLLSIEPHHIYHWISFRSLLLCSTSAAAAAWPAKSLPFPLLPIFVN